MSILWLQSNLPQVPLKIMLFNALIFLKIKAYKSQRMCEFRNTCKYITGILIGLR